MAVDSAVKHQAVSTVIRVVDIVSLMVVESDVSQKDVQMVLSKEKYPKDMGQSFQLTVMNRA